MAGNNGNKAKHGTAKPSLISMAPIGYLGMTAYNGYKEGGLSVALDHTMCTIVPINITARKIDVQRFLPFMGVVAGAYVAKKLVGMTGVNRAMKGLPFRL